MRSLGESALIVFARAPLPGRVKTRLVPAVGEEGAAALYGAFVDDTCALTRGLADRRLLAVDGDHPLLSALAAREGMTIVRQADGDLGARMSAAIDDALDGGASRVCLLGSDSPLLPAAMITGALAALDDADVVLGPADDGGYWTVAVNGRCPALFEGIAWSTKSVLARTLENLAAASIRHALADRFWDVDEPADLIRLIHFLDENRSPTMAPATRTALAERCDIFPRS